MLSVAIIMLINIAISESSSQACLDNAERSNIHEISSLPTFLYQDKKVGQGLRDEIPFGKMFRTLLIQNQTKHFTHK